MSLDAAFSADLMRMWRITRVTFKYDLGFFLDGMPGSPWGTFVIILYFKLLALNMAEREGFEPPIRLPVFRISSAARSTTLPPLQAIDHHRKIRISWSRETPMVTKMVAKSFYLAPPVITNLKAASSRAAASLCIVSVTCE